MALSRQASQPRAEPVSSATCASQRILSCANPLPQARSVPVRTGSLTPTERARTWQVVPLDASRLTAVSSTRIISPRLAAAAGAVSSQSTATLELASPVVTPVLTPRASSRGAIREQRLLPPQPLLLPNTKLQPQPQQQPLSQNLYVTEQDLNGRLEAFRAEQAKQIQALDRRINQLMAETLPRCERSLVQVERAWEPWLEERGALLSKVAELQTEMSLNGNQQQAVLARLSETEAMVATLRDHTLQQSSEAALSNISLPGRGANRERPGDSQAITEDIIALERMINQLRRDVDRALQTSQIEVQKELISLQGQYQKMEVSIAERLRREIDMALDVLERQVTRGSNYMPENSSSSPLPEKPAGVPTTTAVFSTLERENGASSDVAALKEQRQEMEAITAGLRRDLSMRSSLGQMM